MTAPSYSVSGKHSLQARAALSRHPEAAYVPHPLYDDEGFAERMQQAPSGLGGVVAKPLNIKDVNLGVYKICQKPVLTQEQEVHLFQQLNFFRHRANGLRRLIEAGGGTDKVLHDFEQCHKKALVARETILVHNMRIIVNFIKKKGWSLQMYERMSDCSLVVLNVIDKFDWGRGFKLSTYLMTSLFRTVTDTDVDKQNRLVRHGRQVSSNLTEMEDYRGGDKDRQDEQTEQKRLVRKLLRAAAADGPAMERYIYIVKARHGIEREKGMTLEHIGKELRITKERVRQLEKRGMRRLKEIAARLN